MVSRRAALTTIDNPYNPFDNFQEWFFYDVQKGYNSSAYLARIAKTSDSLSIQENDYIIEKAIDEIIANDFMNIYKKVVREVEIDEDNLE